MAPVKKHVPTDALLKEYLRRQQFATAKSLSKSANRVQHPFLKDLFDKQIAFIEDPADHKTALCSRRAGKSYTAVAYLIKEALDNPGVICLYLALTRGSAKRIVNQELHNFNRRYSLGIEFNKTDLTATFPNGSTIMLAGADDTNEIEKLRGSKYALVIIDETQYFNSAHLESLIDEVLEPALLDLSGTLCLLGTPGPNASGYFYSATTNTERVSLASKEDQEAGDEDDREQVLWANHHWTLFDNRHLCEQKLRAGSSVEAYVASIRRRKGWSEDHPKYLREWGGRWTFTDNDLVYQLDVRRNLFSKLPEIPDQWQYVLGIDIGFNDAFTIAVLAFSQKQPKVFMVDQFSQSKLIPADMAKYIAQYRERYDPVAMVADSGALGKAIVEEFKQRYGLNIKAAEKTKKVAYIDLLNGDLISARLLVKEGLPVIAEMQMLEWERDSNRSKENQTQKNDACFVAGTLIRTARGQIPIEQVKPGDLALTRFGWYPVTDAWCSGIKEVHELQAGDKTLHVTGNHEVLTQRGWYSVDSITERDTLYVCRNPEEITFKGTTVIETCGPERMGLFQRITTFITRIMTRKTTISLISNVYQQVRTWLSIGQKILLSDALNHESTSKEQSLRLRRGTGVLKVASGIAKTDICPGQKDNQSLAYVKCVDQAFSQKTPTLRFAPTSATQKKEEIQAKTTSSSIALSVDPSSSTTSTPSEFIVPTGVVRQQTTGVALAVFNITVDGPHEYFANDILVSNCDSLLYGYRECKHWLTDMLPPDDPLLTDPFDIEASAPVRAVASWLEKEESMWHDGDVNLGEDDRWL